MSMQSYSEARVLAVTPPPLLLLPRWPSCSLKAEEASTEPVKDDEDDGGMALASSSATVSSRAQSTVSRAVWPSHWTSKSRMLAGDEEGGIDDAAAELLRSTLVPRRGCSISTSAKYKCIYMGILVDV